MTDAVAYVEQFRKFAASGGGGDDAPEWVRAMRSSALERFTQLGFPTTKNEDWHFTSVAPIAERQFVPLTAPSGDVRRTDLEPFLFAATERWPLAVFVNGRFAPELSHLEHLPAGVRVLPLARAWDEAPELARRIGTVARHDAQTFTALNAAFLHDGAVIHVAADRVAEHPIHLVFVTDRHAANGVSYPRNLVVAGANARATVIESYVGLGDASYFTNAVTEVVVDRGATLAHYKLQRESQNAYHVGTIETTQERDSHYVSFSLATGAALSRTNIGTVLGGEGCGATLNGLYMLDGAQHGDHQTRIEHAQPNTFSRELYKGVLDGESHGVFNGKVYVRPIAQKTDGKQTNNTLLLSERAQIDTKPQLEIFADDVKCTHGATVGRLDEVSLFYMKSRGIGADEARKLLTYAFAADVLETIENDLVRNGLEAMTLARFV
ncbi:MAG: Fe-S cluster assembly protein SufD [Gemmatimonadota bacterium]|nr:Fe-S cluster assembly protein SufD [Gemmatimonadota bacterium]MDE3171505.1 Fe-S cluster assembly protein SufD [Gemmatimonadota bacterium]MDE3215367.1 Fe-S cluster assembly protein SufD [Gemmatimonadota bacterium]